MILEIRWIATSWSWICDYRHHLFFHHDLGLRTQMFTTPDWITPEVRQLTQTTSLLWSEGHKRSAGM
jgi:hypothetical protein